MLHQMFPVDFKKFWEVFKTNILIYKNKKGKKRMKTRKRLSFDWQRKREFILISGKNNNNNKRI